MILKQVAEWLREAAEEKYKMWAELLEHDRAKDKAKKWEARAAQVEAMTCDGCRWWEINPKIGPQTGDCNRRRHDGRNDWNSAIECSPKFGCIHFEKPQDGLEEG